jgi:hypothetical protein
MRSLLTLLAACTHLDSLDAEPAAVAARPETADVEAAPAPSPRRADPPDAAGALARIDSWFAGRGSHRLHVQLDRPLYKPGDTIWIKAWSPLTRGLQAEGVGRSATWELVDPRGQVAQTKQVSVVDSAATNDFVLDPGAAGGKWTLRVTLDSGEVDERPFVVSSYVAPKIRKSLDFVREAYGPGDQVEALVELEDARGPLAGHPIRALLQVDGRAVVEVPLTTDRTGAVFVQASLPADLSSSDGLLTVFVEDGGVVESISRTVPIVLADVRVAFFPEGGDLVAGLPGRVYFEAKDPHGEPADISGFITDDRGRRVAELRSDHDGLGRFALTPEYGRTYTAHITAPVGITQTYPIPKAVDGGCALRSYDDVRSTEREVRVAVRCTSPRPVVVVGTMQESVLDLATVDASPDRDAVVYLTPPDALEDRQGAVRVTVFDEHLSPLAERLVYRNPGKDLRISMKADKPSYGPRDEVVLSVSTTDPSGDPVPAQLAIAVANDEVLSLADDEEGHMLSRVYLEPDLIEAPDDPGWYFDPDEALAAVALDRVMGTKGYRRFVWQPVFTPAVDEVVATTESSTAKKPTRRPMPVAPIAQGPPVDMLAAMPAPEQEALPEPAANLVADAPAIMDDLDDAMAAGVPMPPPAAMRQAAAVEDLRGGELAKVKDAVHGRAAAKEAFWADQERDYRYEPVRTFPRPDYSAGFTGTRTDFRDTVHWEPAVVTDDSGEATVRFYLSDAITTFRAVAEGLGAGFVGRGELEIKSSLPVHVATTLPPAVSAGDHIWMPLTVRSTKAHALDVDVAATVGGSLVRAEHTSGRVAVAANGGATHWVDLSVGQGAGAVPFTLTATGGGLSDTVEQTLTVVAPGFPRSWAMAGDGTSERAFTLDPPIAGSLTATVTWSPSPVSTLITGMDALIREPGGCFEQTSSTNWPNVAILGYLEAHDGDPRLRLQSSKALQSGYDRLTGYQVPAGGFETWGSGPGKEALSAFGLLQFRDMQKVFPVADRVLDEDTKYLMAQRDGKGGFRNSGESAHGYGSAPQPVLDGFITYALVASGQASELGAELTRQVEVARSSTDPYVLALAVRSLAGAAHPAAADGARRLLAMQAADGSFPGAESSITRSYEANLLVESTALAALAVMESGASRPAADKAAAWLVANRQGVGSWGATQATALALGALTRHADESRRPRTGGTVAIEVNGVVAGSVTYSADTTEPIALTGWEGALRAGSNEVVVRQVSGAPLPYTVNVAWTSTDPFSSEGAELDLTTRLDRATARMGETVRLTARLENRTGAVVPSPIARIGLPAGLEASTKQLEDLQKRGAFAFFETRPREVVVYWDGQHADEVHEVSLDLAARVPGTFTGPASSAYPYYDDDEKSWAGGLVVTIDRP